MSEDDDMWRDRLRALLGDRSMREVSLGAGLAHGYLHSILVDRKEAGATKLVKLARELGISPALLFEEADKFEERQRLARTTSTLAPDQIRLLEAFARQMQGQQPSPQSEKSDEPDTPRRGRG